MQKNTIVSIIAAALVLYLLDWGYYTATMENMKAAMPEAYKAALNPNEANPAIWLIVELLGATLLWVVVGRDSSRPINMKSAAMSSALAYGLMSAMVGFYYIVMITDWPMQSEVINTIYAIVSGGIAGYVLAMVHNKMSKA
jgi:hypothetical protein